LQARNSKKEETSLSKAMQHPKKLAGKLKSIRESLGLSQSQMIKMLGFEGELGQSHISSYENEKHNRIPPVGVLLQYSKISNINLERIIDDDLDLR
jgi:transcriptional regulator with XRE-family HTH domain